MIISHYGKKFLKKFNEKENKNLSPKEFFVTIFYPLFFANEKSCLHVMNSPFNQYNPVAKKNRLTPEGRDIILNQFFNKIKNGNIDSSMFVGGAATDLCSATSFNISLTHNYEIDENEIYLSWIGYGLSLYLHGINFLFDDENILYDIYTGWQKYRDLISEKLYDKYTGKEIAKWNTLWLKNKYDEYPDIKFNPFNNSNTYDSKLNILKSISWVKFLFNISQHVDSEIINTYAFKLDKSNITYGNILIKIKKLSSFLNFCKEYFNSNDFLTKSDLYEKIWGTAYSIDKICEFGSIGMLALKPNLLKMEEKQHKTADDKIKIKKQYISLFENNLSNKLYKLYIMANLNEIGIEELVKEIALQLHAFQYSQRKNKGLTLVADLFEPPFKFSKILASIIEIINIAKNINLPISDIDKILLLKDLASKHKYDLDELMHLIKFEFTLINYNN